MEYQKRGLPLVIFGGKEYGTGSSRDWAAKGTNLLGVRAVITESFERIHRSNLVGMGVLPCNFTNGETWQSLGLDGSETVDITGLERKLEPRMSLGCKITRADGSVKEIEILSRLDTVDEVDYYRHGGILHYVLRDLLAKSAAGSA
jgi:aconitate hydratase